MDAAADGPRGQSDADSHDSSSSRETRSDSDGEEDSDLGHSSREEDGDDALEDGSLDESYDSCDDGGDGMGNRKDARHRVIVSALSTLLALLLIHFGYQLLRLSQTSDDLETSHVANAAVNANGNGNDIEGGERIGERKAEDIGRDEKGASGDDEEYEMPRYPTRIYTHSSLSSKNYRAGGVVSDEMLQRFEEDGAVVIRNLVSPKLLDRLDAASQMLIDGQDEAGKKKRRGKQFHMVKNGAIFLGIPARKEGVSCRATAGGDACDAGEEANDTDDNVISSFRDLAMYSKIPRVAASLLRLDERRVGGAQNLKLSRQEKKRQRQEETGFAVDDSINLRICRDIFLTKDDDPYACGWHVDDTGFWPNVASDPGVNAWVALDDMGGFSWPQHGVKSKAAPMDSGENIPSIDRPSPVATFALSLGSHRAPWRHNAYKITGSTHTVPAEGFQSAADLIKRRSGSGTCNIETSAPDLFDKLEANKVIYDLKRGDVIFHDRWVFHRTVTVSEHDMMINGNTTQKRPLGESDSKLAPERNNIFRRYSIRYAPGTARVPPGYGVELSVLHDQDNANRSMDEIVERSGPWYPQVWPHVLKTKPAQLSESSGVESEEEIEGITRLIHEIMPATEELQQTRKKEIQRLLSMRGGL